MIRKKVVLVSNYYGCDEEFEFYIEENATEEEIKEKALQCIMSNIEWYIEDENEEED